jgi:hypothetical protein
MPRPATVNSGVDILSPELLARIFEYVLGDQYAGVLLHVMLVSRAWKVRT